MRNMVMGRAGCLVEVEHEEHLGRPGADALHLDQGWGLGKHEGYS